jgi:hypothetical protein
MSFLISDASTSFSCPAHLAIRRCMFPYLVCKSFRRALSSSYSSFDQSHAFFVRVRTYAHQVFRFDPAGQPTGIFLSSRFQYLCLALSFYVRFRLISSRNLLSSCLLLVATFLWLLVPQSRTSLSGRFEGIDTSSDAHLRLPLGRVAASERCGGRRRAHPTAPQPAPHQAHLPTTPTRTQFTIPHIPTRRVY